MRKINPEMINTPGKMAQRAVQARAEDCRACNSPTMIDLSNAWENPQILFEDGGIQVD